MELYWETDAAAATAMLRTNCSAVEQILFNLIENACKYAERADDRIIRIQTQVQSGELVIHVCDQGPGISREVAKRLFHPFHKSSEEAARTAPGVGLGLALCRRLARDLGGDLQLDTAVSNGACFHLRLPLGPNAG
jgi:K+-sensing histidine kinase KdpD